MPRVVTGSLKNIRLLEDLKNIHSRILDLAENACFGQDGQAILLFLSVPRKKISSVGTFGVF
jgi:hypothetical protein